MTQLRTGKDAKCDKLGFELIKFSKSDIVTEGLSCRHGNERKARDYF